MTLDRKPSGTRVRVRVLVTDALDRHGNDFRDTRRGTVGLAGVVTKSDPQGAAVALDVGRTHWFLWRELDLEVAQPG